MSRLFPAICKVVARLVGKHLFSVNAAAQAEAPFSAEFREFLRSGVLALSPYATKMVRSLLLAERSILHLHGCSIAQADRARPSRLIA
jgi:hypothetical protein